eukprot:scaffold158621_cov38-Cyclotella_meneghiniana.AAC.1
MIDGIASTVPAASSLGPHRSIPRRDVNRDSSTNRTNSLKTTTTHPSENHFDPEDVFRNIPTNVHPNGNSSSSISDSDLDRLLGPLPSRRAALEQDGRERKKGPGNMIVVCPRCLHRGFGVVGPHWIGPISCFILLTIATATLTPKAYANINPVSCYICIAFYVLGVVSLVIVTCSDPGIVKREMMCVPRDISEERVFVTCKYISKFTELYYIDTPRLDNYDVYYAASINRPEQSTVPIATYASRDTIITVLGWGPASNPRVFYIDIAILHSSTSHKQKQMYHDYYREVENAE